MDNIDKGDKDSRVTPEALVTPEKLNAIINTAQNERDKAQSR